MEWGCWDVACVERWRYPGRTEELVVLLKCRNTPTARLRRCLYSLVLQDWQDWEAVVVNDVSTGPQWRLLLEGLKPFASRIPQTTP